MHAYLSSAALKPHAASPTHIAPPPEPLLRSTSPRDITFKSSPSYSAARSPRSVSRHNSFSFSRGRNPSSRATSPTRIRSPPAHAAVQSQQKHQQAAQRVGAARRGEHAAAGEACWSARAFPSGGAERDVRPLAAAAPGGERPVRGLGAFEAPRAARARDNCGSGGGGAATSSAGALREARHSLLRLLREHSDGSRRGDAVLDVSRLGGGGGGGMSAPRSPSCGQLRREASVDGLVGMGARERGGSSSRLRTSSSGSGSGYLYSHGSATPRKAYSRDASPARHGGDAGARALAPWSRRSALAAFDGCAEGTSQVFEATVEDYDGGGGSGTIGWFEEDEDSAFDLR